MNFPKPDIPNPEHLSGTKLYVVGGAVRDKLMHNNSPNDIDYVVVGATESQLLNAGLKQVGKDFPVFLTPSGAEIAMARTEKKTGVGYYGFECQFNPEITLEEDLARRDFTINSIAWDVEEERLIDPLRGQEDIIDRVIRANTSAFSEDPLRVLRAARMAARFGFQIVDDTKEMAKGVSQEEFDSIPKERIVLETEKAFQQCDKPSFYFKCLDNMKALGKVFPEVKELQDVEEPKLWHPEGNTFNHTMLVIDALKELEAEDIKHGRNPGFPSSFFWAALLHDFGKKVSTQMKNGTVHHYNHETTGLPLVESFVEKFKLDNSTRKHALNVTKHHMMMHDYKKLRKITRARFLDSLHVIHSMDELAAICWCSLADRNGREGAVWEGFNEGFKKPLNDATLFKAVKGDDVLTPEEMKSAKPEVIREKLLNARAKVLTEKG
jgi:tRNA nucleotidyltransferase (CCA-adding enzyme)